MPLTSPPFSAVLRAKLCSAAFSCQDAIYNSLLAQTLQVCGRYVVVTWLRLLGGSAHRCLCSIPWERNMCTVIYPSSLSCTSWESWRMISTMWKPLTFVQVSDRAVAAAPPCGLNPSAFLQTAGRRLRWDRLESRSVTTRLMSTNISSAPCT